MLVGVDRMLRHAFLSANEREKRMRTLFGGIDVRFARFGGADAVCDGACIQNATPSALDGRSTPKYDAMRAKLAV